ncbi:hypothetical protein Zmor_009415 [Zophobas morio]|uniref:Uncharacterized protein n=1 Tax=Zophobas morio TaxID=2755281 RepID=A0AA38IGN5_9CUCU|nr:hypothetical protein Zmor_009415 [Zophobas morio]
MCKIPTRAIVRAVHNQSVAAAQTTSKHPMARGPVVPATDKASYLAEDDRPYAGSLPISPAYQSGITKTHMQQRCVPNRSGQDCSVFDSAPTDYRN